MKIVVCGGKDLHDRQKVEWSLDYWLQRLSFSSMVIISDPRRPGGAPATARDWAAKRQIRLIEEGVADDEWKKLGASAEVALNRRVFARHSPEYLIAFSGGAEVSDILAQAPLAGVKRIEVA